MTEDDKLVEMFFLENPIEVADDGFTERVMQSLPELEARPSRAWKLSRIWTFLCIFVGVAVFIADKGWVVLYSLLKSWVSNLHIDFSSLSGIQWDTHSLMMYGVGAIVLLLLGTYDLVTEN